MKRLLIISALLLAVVFSVTADRRRLLLARNVAAASCATTDTTFSHGQFLEGFQTATTGYENSGWTVGAGTFDPYTDTSALTTGKLAGQCDRAISVPSGANVYAYRDFGAGVLTLPLTVRFMFYCDAQTDGAYARILTIGSATTLDGGVNNSVQFSRVGSTYQVRGAGVSQSSWQSINVGQWNTIVLRIDHSTSTSSYISVNGGANQTFDSDGTGGERYLIIGEKAFIGTPATGTLYFDTIAID